ncbi:MAG TPA: PQQ-binding-like beta-propeller repeat protein [Gemmatimonadales bacterium]|jgi:PQQ-dependent dehydrogenase (methanol/ethanol family)|nr:PQQ-binding-like beta-propeller repeat protein [Gemmatimonadales bacterium]
MKQLWLGLLAAAAIATPAQAQGNWTTYGGTDWNQRWSTLARITTSNVSRLVPRMLFQTGTSKLGSLETTPLVVDGTMYVTTPYSEAIIAYDLRTNKQLWRQEPKIGTTITCCGPVNRGVAVGGGSVFVGTLDARLLAFDARTGKPKWDVEVADPTFGYSITMAPLIVGEHVIVGVSGGEYGIRGHLDAYDMATGKQVWRWYSIPAPGDDPVATNGWWGTWATHAEDADLHRDIAREKADSTKYADAWKTGGGGVWTTPSYDKASNTIYATVGNPSPDLDGSVRPGDNLFTDGIVAIDATTGKTKWYYQTVPHDVWDLDATSPSAITELGGKKVVLHAGKTGWLYVVDAATGKLVRKSQNFVPHENMFALPTAKGTRMLPGANGGSEWSPISVNPKLGYAFVAALHQPMNYITHTAPWEKGRLWLGSAFVAIPGEEQYGLFSAIDLKTGKIAWQNKVPQPMMGGSLSTAGGLTFTGEGNGNFNAYDSRTGKLLWQFNAGAGCNGTPMSFELDREQFIGMACGGNFQLSYPLGSAILIFGLPKAPAGR